MERWLWHWVQVNSAKEPADVWQSEQLDHFPRCSPEKMGKNRASCCANDPPVQVDVVWHATQSVGKARV